MSTVRIRVRVHTKHTDTDTAVRMKGRKTEEKERGREGERYAEREGERKGNRQTDSQTDRQRCTWCVCVQLCVSNSHGSTHTYLHFPCVRSASLRLKPRIAPREARITTSHARHRANCCGWACPVGRRVVDARGSVEVTHSFPVFDLLNRSALVPSLPTGTRVRVASKVRFSSTHVAAYTGRLRVYSASSGVRLRLGVDRSAQSPSGQSTGQRGDLPSALRERE